MRGVVSRNSSENQKTIEIVRSALALSREAFVERLEVDYHSLMGPVTDLFCLVTRRHLEHNPLSLGLDHFGLGSNVMADGRRGKMPNIDFGADRAILK